MTVSTAAHATSQCQSSPVATPDDALESLNRLLSHKSDSLFGFVLAASPHVPSGDEAILTAIADIARRHVAQARILTDLILSLDGVPNPVGHDIGIADLNYLSVRHLLNELIRYQEHVVAETRAAIATHASIPAIGETLRPIMAADATDLGRLKSFVQARPASAPAA